MGCLKRHWSSSLWPQCRDLHSGRAFMTVRPGRAAVLALACAFTSSCVSTNSHASSPPAATPVAPISTTGPTPGHWHAAWTRTLSVVPAEGEIRDLALVGGVLVAASPQGVEALDARTGTTVWRSDSFDRSGVAAIAGTLRRVDSLLRMDSRYWPRRQRFPSHRSTPISSAVSTARPDAPSGTSVRRNSTAAHRTHPG